MRFAFASASTVLCLLLSGCQTTTTTAATPEAEGLPDAQTALPTLDAAMGRESLDAGAQATDAGPAAALDAASSPGAASSPDAASREAQDAASRERDAEANVGDASSAPGACAVTAPTACPTPMPRYADVEPIFKQRCVVCHSPMWTGPWPLDQYQHVADWQVDIRADLLDCSMPPPDAGVALPLEERTAILSWLRCGLPQ